jgi:uncharacterized repeat protein (TIGR03943 family)
VLPAGIVLALLSLIFALFPVNAECCAATGCSHPLSRFAAGKWLTFLVLILPISAAAYYSPKNYSESTILNRGVLTDAANLPQPSKVPPKIDLPLPTKDGSSAAAAPAAAPTPAASAPQTEQQQDYLTRTPEGYIVAEVLDMLYAAQDDSLRKDFEGKTVEMIGQLMPETSNNPKGNRFKAVRMFMVCCAADARPIASIVEARQPPDFPEMSWVKIIGTATFPMENGKRIPVVKAERVEKTDPPAETMLY